MNIQTWLDTEMGRNARMAKHFGLTPGAITQWRSNGVPLRRMKAVRAYTQGQVALEDMLPDAVAPMRVKEGVTALVKALAVEGAQA